MPFLLFPFLSLFMVVFIGYLGLRAVRAMERRGIRSIDVAQLSSRIEDLESQLELQASEIRRLSEGQSFTERLLQGRKTDGAE